MKIAFGDFLRWDFHAQSVETQPLGGSQSAACYLAQALSRRGHEVSLFTHTKNPALHAGVKCYSWQTMPLEALRTLELDIFVCLLRAGNGPALRTALGPGCQLVLWTQHASDQPDVQTLALTPERDSYAGFAFVSEWQRAGFVSRFTVPTECTWVLQNAAAPAFINLFAEGEMILSTKVRPPIIAYTSTPFRGLDLLLDAFPTIRTRVPGTRLRVYSSMKVYQVAPMLDHLEFGALYARCRSMPGVEYVGSLPQPVLATELRDVTTLAYPNTFPETSCIVALEAMASGCRIVTSQLGALPETTAGFAELVAVDQDRKDYLAEFSERVIATLLEAESAPAAVEDCLQRQIRHIQNGATWDHRAVQWEEWLHELVETGSPPRRTPTSP